MEPPPGWADAITHLMTGSWVNELILVIAALLGLSLWLYSRHRDRRQKYELDQAKQERGAKFEARLAKFEKSMSTHDAANRESAKQLVTFLRSLCDTMGQVEQTVNRLADHVKSKLGKTHSMALIRQVFDNYTVEAVQILEKARANPKLYTNLEFFGRQAKSELSDALEAQQVWLCQFPMVLRCSSFFQTDPTKVNKQYVLVDQLWEKFITQVLAPGGRQRQRDEILAGEVLTMVEAAIAVYLGERERANRDASSIDVLGGPSPYHTQDRPTDLLPTEKTDEDSNKIRVDDDTNRTTKKAIP